MEATKAPVEEVGIVITQQTGLYPPNTRLSVPVGMAHDLLKANRAVIHADSKKDWEYWNTLYAKADAKDDAEAAARGAMNAKQQAEAKKVVEHPATMERLKSGHGDPIQAPRVAPKKQTTIKPQVIGSRQKK